MYSLIQDLRLTCRALAARPGWTAAAILCLAIATGANTAAYTLVNGLLLRPLPFDEPNQLVMIALREPKQASTRPFSLREYRELSDRSGGTATLLARTFFPLSLSANDGARMVQTELVSGSYFETLRLEPFIGRFFTDGDDREGAPLVVVLSHRLWQRRFGADPGTVGNSVRVNGRPATIVAVAPPGFVGAMRLVAADLWLPASTYPALAGSPDAATVPMFGVMGRLGADVTREQAEARLTSAATTLAIGQAAAPAVVITAASGFGVPVSVQGTVLTLSGFIYVMMALLMTVACANVAALVLARGAGRHREIAVRLSLGATRARIARQLLTESSVLALAGCAAGTIVALWLTNAFVAGLTTPFQYVSYAIDVHPDVRVLACSAIATATAAMLCGIAPIRLAGRVDVVDAIKQSAAPGRSRQSRRTLDTMVVMQFAVSTALLVAAGTVVRAYIAAQSTPLGFESRGLVTSTLDLDQLRLDAAAGTRTYETAMERLAALPGVARVGLTSDLPLRAGRRVTVIADAETTAGAAGEQLAAASTVVSSRYFETLGVTIREGRGFAGNEPARPLVAVVNEALARRLWPNRSPLGRTFRPNQPNAEAIEVIGVVSNAVEAGPADAGHPAFYRPFPAEYHPRMTLVMRVNSDPAAFFTAVRRTIQDVDADLSITDLRTMDGVITAYAEPRRLPATALSLVGLLGLVLSAVGLYGVVAYGVRERARELAIRLALGAKPADVRRLVLRQGFGIVGIGTAIGAVATAIVIQVLRSWLVGAGSMDPWTLAGVCAVLSGVGFVALYVPARWASRLEPAQTLRND